MRIRNPGGGGPYPIQRLTVLENELVFGPDGWADADHLTDTEVQRLVRFGFQVDVQAKRVPPSPPVDETTREPSSAEEEAPLRRRPGRPRKEAQSA